MSKDNKLSLWEIMFTKTPKEEEIESRIDEEYDSFTSSPEHIAHKERLKKLYDELHVAQSERMENAKKYRRERRKKNSISLSDEEVKKRREENRKKKEEEIDSLPSDLRDTIRKYESLSEDEKKVFNKMTWVYKTSLDTMKNIQITHEQTRQLHDILVQTCIDFINENGLKDVDEVSFSADSLQASAKFNEWTSSTDSYLEVDGIEYDDTCKFKVRKFIDKSF